VHLSARDAVAGSQSSTDDAVYESILGRSRICSSYSSEVKEIYVSLIVRVSKKL
jgi:hypothetical protein